MFNARQNFRVRYIDYWLHRKLDLGSFLWARFRAHPSPASFIQNADAWTVSFFGLFGRRKADDAPTAAPVIGADGKPDVPIVGQGKISGITAHILSTSVDSNGHVIIITDTNQVWKTIETGSVRGGVEGAEITIRESSFNGFRLNVIGRTGEYRVQRIL